MSKTFLRQIFVNYKFDAKANCNGVRSKTVALSTNESGIAAEFFVAAELAKRGFYVSPTLKNTKSVDILIVDEKLQNPLLIQVKASQNKKEWKLTDKAETLVSPKWDLLK